LGRRRVGKKLEELLESDLEEGLRNGFEEGIGGEKEKGVVRICLTEQGGVSEVLKGEERDFEQKMETGKSRQWGWKLKEWTSRILDFGRTEGVGTGEIERVFGRIIREAKTMASPGF